MNSTVAAFIQPIAIELGQPPQIYQSYAIVTWSPPTAKLCLLLAWGEQWIFHHGQQIIPHSSSGQTGKTQTWDLFGGQEDSNMDGEQCFHSVTLSLVGSPRDWYCAPHLATPSQMIWMAGLEGLTEHCQGFWWHRAGCWGGHIRRERSQRDLDRLEEWVKTGWSLTKTSADSCPWVTSPKSPLQAGLCGWGAALLKGTLGHGGWVAQHVPAVNLLQ